MLLASSQAISPSAKARKTARRSHLGRSDGNISGSRLRYPQSVDFHTPSPIMRLANDIKIKQSVNQSLNAHPEELFEKQQLLHPHLRSRPPNLPVYRFSRRKKGRRLLVHLRRHSHYQMTEFMR